MIESCPKCGGTAVLLQSKEEVREVPDLADPTRTDRLTIKVEEFRCQKPSCEHEFEKIIGEPTPPTSAA
jgi:transposase